MKNFYKIKIPLYLIQNNVNISEKINITKLRVNSNDIYIAGHVKTYFIGPFER